jgi:hypothetical protein
MAGDVQEGMRRTRGDGMERECLEKGVEVVMCVLCRRKERLVVPGWQARPTEYGCAGRCRQEQSSYGPRSAAPFHSKRPIPQTSYGMPALRLHFNSL